VDERISASGDVMIPLDRESLKSVAASLREARVEAVAISFLNSYRNPVHEQLAERILAELLPDLYISAGTTLTNEWGEFERASTAAANAFVGVRMKRYVSGFTSDLKERDFGGTLYMMGSNGGAMSVRRTLTHPLALLESGPVGGCIGAGAYARALGLDKLIAFDMGGTTAKCALVEGGQFDVHTTYYVGGYETGFPVRTPVLDIIEVGAGGGSIGWIDNGRLRLGPRSAGSEPGPICFGRGGVEPTITDANLVLGRIGSDSFMGGKLQLDAPASRTAIAKLAADCGYPGEGGVDRVAEGLLDLAVITMTGAIKEISTERGRDIRDYDLFVFGGGGPLFGAQLARELGVNSVIVPPAPGTFSSFGMLMADARLDVAKTFLNPLNDESTGELADEFAALEAEATQVHAEGGSIKGIYFSREFEMRYRGQKQGIRVAAPQGMTVSAILKAYEEAYARRYGSIRPNMVVEFVMLIISAFVPMPRPDLKSSGVASQAPEPRTIRSVYHGLEAGRLETKIYRREEIPIGAQLVGPAVIEEFSATTVLGPGDVLTVGKLGELRIVC
jgi:N-methylhydantoinase A